MKLMELALKTEKVTSNLEIIHQRGRYVLIRLANGLGGEVKLVGREWLETYLDEIETLSA